MNKTTNIFLILLLCISCNAFGQSNTRSIDGIGFKSVFQNLKSGKFNGTINGLLIIKNSANKKVLLDFQGSSSKLNIEQHAAAVYDVSYKNYMGKSTTGKSVIHYSTYATANSLALKLKGEWFELDLIDGACDGMINGLDYAYEAEKDNEYLIIKVTKKITLHNRKNVMKTIKILPNSTLVIAINRNH